MKLISRDELLAKLARGEEFKLVMATSAFGYRSKRIPTSLYFETAEEILASLDPSEEIVVYCAGVYSPASIYAYRLLERNGYARVRRYAGGIDDWEEAGYPVERGSVEPAPEPKRTPKPARRLVRLAPAGA